MAAYIWEDLYGHIGGTGQRAQEGEQFKFCEDLHGRIAGTGQRGTRRRTVSVLHLAVVSVFVQPEHSDHAALPGGRHAWHGARGAKGAEQDADVDSTTDSAT